MFYFHLGGKGLCPFSSDGTKPNLWGLIVWCCAISKPKHRYNVALLCFGRCFLTFCWFSFQVIISTQESINLHWESRWWWCLGSQIALWAGSWGHPVPALVGLSVDSLVLFFFPPPPLSGRSILKLVGGRESLSQCRHRSAVVRVQVLEGCHEPWSWRGPEMAFYIGHMGLMKDGDIFALNIQSSETPAQSRQAMLLLKRH